MSDETEERPLNELRTGRANYNVYDNLLEYLNFGEGTIEGNQEEIISRIKTAKKGLDLGSGYGYSAVSMKKFSPELEEIVGVDVLQPPDPNLVKDLPFQYVKKYLNAFLEESEGGFDLALLSGVPDHRLSEKGYKNLARNMTPNGLVVETGDTGLSEEEMNKYFTKVFEPNRMMVGGMRDTIWKKKEEIKGS